MNCILRALSTKRNREMQMHQERVLHQHLHIDSKIIHIVDEIVVYIVESVASRSTNCSHLETQNKRLGSTQSKIKKKKTSTCFGCVENLPLC